MQQTVAALQERIRDLEKALLYVLQWHQAPGDPAYSWARKVVSYLLPDNECHVSFHDDKSG